MTTDLGPLVILGSGGQPYREYALESAARAARRPVVMLLREPATWQRRHVADTLVAPLADHVSVVAALRRLPVAASGLLTWDETLVETAARVAESLGLPQMTLAAARACRDKLATRIALAARGVPSARFRHVSSLPEAATAAEQIGFPVVLKPRGLAGSMGVVVADGAEDLPAAYDAALNASVPGLANRAGILVEEFLTGPELSVDSLVRDGSATAIHVARKMVGFAPYFEEVGHLALPWRHEPWAGDLQDVVAQAHEALGVSRGVTHTEVKLTSDGPRVIEVNGRLGGDLIPHIGRLATGVDLVGAAVELAVGVSPSVQETRSRCAGVRFLYPPQDATVIAVDVSVPPAYSTWLERVEVLAPPGMELRLPPLGLTPRYAAVVVTADSEQECTTRLDEAAERVHLAYEPLERRQIPC